MNTNEQEKKQDTEPIEAASVAADALSPVGGESLATGRIAELERQLQQERVEKGRLRQVNDELRQAREELARLKAENESLQKNRQPGDYLSDEEKDLIDAGQLAAIDKVVRGRVEEATASVRAANDRMREDQSRRDAEDAQRAKARFNTEVDRLAPGLAAAVGEYASEWQEWIASPRRSASVAQAFESNDAETVAEFLKEFADVKGIRADGDGIAARPDSSFSPRGGSRPVREKGDSSVYTVEQVSQALRAAAADFEAGRITIDERRAIQKKYDDAYAEGRVVER